MRAQDHGHFLQRGVSGAFADAVDGDFALAGAVQDTGNGVGGGHAQVIVAVGGEDGVLDAVHVVAQVFNLGAVFLRKAVARGVGDVHDRGAGLDDGFHHPGQEFILGPAGIFGIELNVFHIFLGILDGPDGPLQDFFPGGIEFILDVGIGRADSGVDAFVFGILQGLGGYVDILFYRARKGADGGPGHGLGNLDDRIEIAGAGNGEPRFDNIHAQTFQCLGHLDFLYGIQLASGDLFAVTQRGVEKINPVLVHIVKFFRHENVLSAS